MESPVHIKSHGKYFRNLTSLKWSKKVKILRIKSDSKISTHSSINIFRKSDEMQSNIAFMCVFLTNEKSSDRMLARIPAFGRELSWCLLPIVIKRFITGLFCVPGVIDSFLIRGLNSLLSFRYYWDLNPSLQLTIMQNWTKYAFKGSYW